MANNFFRFKQFTVFQNESVLKVSTDSVLLGAWVPNGNYQKVLDVGTGTGLLALMAAQRFPQATIDAVEIDAESCKIAEENFRLSPFAKRIRLFETEIQKFAEKYPENSYDLIISNPPYFENQKPSLSESKNIQKHSRFLLGKELIAIVKTMLTPKGVFAVILPFDEGKIFMADARFHGLFPAQITEVYVRQEQPMPKRLLLSFSITLKETISQKLYLEDENRHRSQEYQLLTEAFYL
ncbi:MAG: methyltransferase [Bacteroidales bacterium]|nr:methyltransferase [Bacteroidales bacterium]